MPHKKTVDGPAGKVNYDALSSVIYTNSPLKPCLSDSGVPK
ncbi:MAG: hypothetical protein R2941_03090 [Desulfobacterales bacterium]